MKNKMTPAWRRGVAVGLPLGSSLAFGLAWALGWSLSAFWGVMGVNLLIGFLVVGFWPSNKALAEAEKMKELGDG